MPGHRADLLVHVASEIGADEEDLQRPAGGVSALLSPSLLSPLSHSSNLLSLTFFSLSSLPFLSLLSHGLLSPFSLLSHMQQQLSNGEGHPVVVDTRSPRMWH